VIANAAFIAATTHPTLGLAALARENARLVEALERIGWHEPTWQEARDIARAALAPKEPERAEEGT